MSDVPGAFAKSFNCPCCRNPWNQQSDAAIAGSLFCAPCLADDKGFKGIDPANFDSKVSPRGNFYLWSNGGWKEANPIPLEYSSWNTFIVLRDLNLDRLKVILDELGSSENAQNQSTSKLADYYTSFMDESTIEARGVSVLTDSLRLCLAPKVSSTNPHFITLCQTSNRHYLCCEPLAGSSDADDGCAAQPIRGQRSLLHVLQPRQEQLGTHPVHRHSRRTGPTRPGLLF